MADISDSNSELKFKESSHFDTSKATRAIIDMDVAATVRQIDQALRSFFKPQYGSPPSAQIVMDAMTAGSSSQVVQVVHRYSGLIYSKRMPAGDPLRRYMTLFRSESRSVSHITVMTRVIFNKKDSRPSSVLTLNCFRRLIKATIPEKGLSKKYERIVEYKESLTGVEDSCFRNSLVMQFGYSSTDEKHLECRVQMSDHLLEADRNKSDFLKSAFYPFGCSHPARETVYEFSFSHTCHGQSDFE